MVSRPERAIYCSSKLGPKFGGVYGIRIVDNANQNNESQARLAVSYSPPNGVTDRSTILSGTRFFSPDEVEVFYLA